MRLFIMFAILLLTVISCQNPPQEPAPQPSQTVAEDAADQYFLPDGDFSGAHILIAYKGAFRAAETVVRSKEEAQAKAQQLASRLREDPGLFGELATMESDGPSGKNGGKLGVWKKGAMTPAFDSAVALLEEGQITAEPVETPFGYHVIKRDPIRKLKHYGVYSFVIPFKSDRGVPASVSRSKEDAKALADALAPELTSDNFEQRAEEHNELAAGPLRPFVFKENDPMPEGLLPLVESLPFGGVGGPVELEVGFAFIKRDKVVQYAGGHILIAYQGARNAGAEVTRSKDEAQAKARELIAELSKDPDKFAEFAEANSDGPTRADGGNLGSWFKGAMVPEFDAAMARLAVGEITAEPVETSFGYHIIRRRALD